MPKIYRIESAKESATYVNATGRVYCNGNDGAHRTIKQALVTAAGSSNGINFWARVNRKIQSGAGGSTEWETAEFTYTDSGNYATRVAPRISSNGVSAVAHSEGAEVFRILRRLG